MAYRDFLIKGGDVSSVGVVKSDTSAQGGFYRSSEEWGVYVIELPFSIMPELKDLPKNDWYDQSGDDEYFPEQPVFKAYEMTVKFAVKGSGSLAELSPRVRSFIKFLAMTGEFVIYSEYSGVGRRKVRYVGYEDSAQLENDGEGSYLEFSVKLKVNDPITPVVAVTDSSGNIIGLGKEES